MKNKPIIQEKSSEKLSKFLEKNSLHKKDFAEMIEKMELPEVKVVYENRKARLNE